MSSCAAAERQAPPLLDLHPAPADMRQLVIDGLSRNPKQLPAWFLYDAEGSRLFDLICQQPEYTLTATETALLEREAASIAAALGAGTLVEFGAGSARKVAPLLQALPEPAYVALDISADHLQAACTRLQQQFPELPILGVCCDYSQLEQLPAHPLLSGTAHLGFFPGSSLGNFTPAAAQALLAQFRRLLGPGGWRRPTTTQPACRRPLPSTCWRGSTATWRAPSIPTPSATGPAGCRKPAGSRWPW